MGVKLYVPLAVLTESNQFCIASLMAVFVAVGVPSGFMSDGSTLT